MGNEPKWHSAQSYGASGRQGHAGNAATGRDIAEDVSGAEFPSDNHLNEGTCSNAINGLGYDHARYVFDHAIGLKVPELQNQSSGGITEDGSLYGGTGHLQPIAEIGICARRDGKTNERNRARGVCRSLVAHAVASCVWKIPTKIDGWIGNSLVSVGAPNLKGKLWLCGMDGPRGVFNGDWGWSVEAQKAHILQNLLDAPGRVLASRYANNEIGDDNWDGHWMVLAMLSDLVGATPTAAQLSSAFANERLDPEDFGLTENECEKLLAFVESGGVDHFEFVRETTAGIAYKFSRDILRLTDGRVITVASHSTSGPKPPVVWSEYNPTTGLQRYCCPNEYESNQAGDGIGFLEFSGGKWRAVGLSEDDGNLHKSEPWDEDDVLFHWHYIAKSTKGYEPGILDPGGSAPPPPPGDDMQWQGSKKYASLSLWVNQKLEDGWTVEDLKNNDEYQERYKDWLDAIGVEVEPV